MKNIFFAFVSVLVLTSCAGISDPNEKNIYLTEYTYLVESSIGTAVVSFSRSAGDETKQTVATPYTAFISAGETIVYDETDDNHPMQIAVADFNYIEASLPVDVDGRVKVTVLSNGLPRQIQIASGMGATARVTRK